MASVNKAILLGNVGRDPEIRYLPSGVAVANFSLATSSKRKDKQSGETIEETQWHRIVMFDRLAEIAGEYVRKGNPLYVEGRVVYRKYVGQDGIEKHSTEIIASELQLLGGKREEGGGQEQREQAPQRPQPPTRQVPTRTASLPGAGGSGFDDIDDDIPF